MSDIDEYPSIKSNYAALLNCLVEMQQSPAYAFRRGTLVDAERVILAQERRIAELEARANQFVIVRQFCALHRGDAIANAPAPDYRGVCPSCEAFHAQE